jgi:glutamine synthetase
MKDLGIVKRMPKSLQEALKGNESQFEGLAEFLGRQVLEHHILVKECELEEFSKMTEIERISLYLEYF